MKKLFKEQCRNCLKLVIAVSCLATMSLPKSFASSNRDDLNRIIQNQTTQKLVTQDSSDISKLIQYYQETSIALQNSISGLSNEQLRFKTDENHWSVSQCLEHIILTEKMLFGMIQQQLEKDSQLDSKSQRSQTDEEIVKTITNRSQKFQAPETLQPKGQYETTNAAWEDFSKERNLITDYIKKADIVKLRSHLSKYPTGVADGYQSLLFLAAHTARHTAQIQEIKSNANFPK